MTGVFGSRLVAAATAAVAAVAALGGCDSGGPARPQPSPVAESTTSSASMTAVPEQAQCATHRDLGRGGNADLPIQRPFGKDVGHGVDVNDEFTPGPDSNDDGRCRTGPLPSSDTVWCGQPIPWLSTGWPEMVDALGADRIRRVSLSTDEGVTASGRPAGRTLGYVEISIRQGDPRGAMAYLEGAFDACADAAPATVGGIEALAGSVPSVQGSQGEARVMAFLQPTRAAWVVLDGREWTKGERDLALGVIAARLR